jgi:UDP-N-acetylmuramyl pentapeptide phosphotransferase/UDP-N-acetylglucosamine-1-phosphate transferase
MHYLLLFIFLISVTYFLNIVIKKNKLLIDKRDIFHKSITGKEHVQIIGGIILIISILIFLPNLTLLEKIFLIAVFLVGFFSDLNYITSPKKRILLQIFIIFFFIYLIKLNIPSTKILPLDWLLENNLFNIFFTTFCILIIINGSNFIDGINTLNIGYFIIIFINLIFLNQNQNIIIEKEFINYLLSILLFLFLLNSFNFLYMGDGGAYLLGFLSSYYLIKFSNVNMNISPYYIILLLWYPGFENLFSIIRKSFYKKIPLNPDDKHLHQLLFSFLKNKFSCKQYSINTLTGLIINFYNLLVISLGSNYYSKTNILCGIVFINITLYCLAYRLLKSKK